MFQLLSKTDFNGDSLITEEDISQAVAALTRSELSQEEIKICCDKVFEEADMDDDRAISQTEFQHVILRSPEFTKYVRIYKNIVLTFFLFFLFEQHFSYANLTKSLDSWYSFYFLE